MASGSLRIREELVWEPDYVDEYYVPPSSPFLFMNLRWKLKICSHYDYVDHSSKLSYKIYLINQDERLHEPFKVSTFIEFRKSNVRLQCSTMTISSIEESLYKVSADSIPELSIVKQAAVIVRFFPSTGLAVREETANESASSYILKDKPSDLRIRQSLIWEASKASIMIGCVSPTFSLMNSLWKFEMHSEEETELGRDTDCRLIYKIVLRNCGGIHANELKPFSVSTFLEDKRDFKEMQCSTIIVFSIRETLYECRAEEMLEKLPGLMCYDDIIVSCHFCPSIGLKLSGNEENDAVQSTSVNFLQDIEILSENFINLLDNVFMADVQVKSGECIIPAHKAVLAARSELLSTKLQNIEFQNVNAVMNFDDVEPAILCIFLRCLYSGKIVDDLSEGTLRELHKVSVKYDVPTLRKFCLNNMTRNLNRENVTKISDIHHECKNKEMKYDAGYEHENDNLKFAGGESDILYEREEEQKITAPDSGIAYKRKDNVRQVEPSDVGLTYEHEDELTLLAPDSDVAYEHENNELEVTAADLDLAYERGDKELTFSTSDMI